MYLNGERVYKNSAKSSNCCVLRCSSVTWSVTLLVVSNTFQAELQPSFQRFGLQYSGEVIFTPRPLCKHHYISTSAEGMCNM